MSRGIWNVVVLDVLSILKHCGEDPVGIFGEALVQATMISPICSRNTASFFLLEEGLSRAAEWIGDARESCVVRRKGGHRSGWRHEEVTCRFRTHQQHLVCDTFKNCEGHSHVAFLDGNGWVMLGKAAKKEETSVVRTWLLSWTNLARLSCE